MIAFWRRIIIAFTPAGGAHRCKMVVEELRESKSTCATLQPTYCQTFGLQSTSSVAAAPKNHAKSSKAVNVKIWPNRRRQQIIIKRPKFPKSNFYPIRFILLLPERLESATVVLIRFVVRAQLNLDLVHKNNFLLRLVIRKDALGNEMGK